MKSDVQRAFYARGAHEHLRPSRNDYYAGKLVRNLVAQMKIGAGDRVLEVGAGFGRFTFHLLEHCGSVVALDLSERALSDLDRARGDFGVEASRLRSVRADVGALSADDLPEPVDHVLGFFVLHHLADVAGVIRRLAGFVRPGGGMGFLEPNRRNPLFLLQVMVCRDMDWESEKGMFLLRRAAVLDAYRAAGLDQIESSTFGMFPPFMLNRSSICRRAEEAIESRAFLSSWLPFMMMTGRRARPMSVGRPAERHG